MWVSHVLHDWHATLSIYLRFVAASRLMRRLKREVELDALLRKESSLLSLLQTLACSCRSSARANGPSVSLIFPFSPPVRPFTYLGVPWESTMSSAMVCPARRFGSTTCRTLVVLGLGLGLGLVLGLGRARARAMWARARVLCRTLLSSSRRASWPTTQTAQERVPEAVGPTEFLTSSFCGL
eukprot:scaffold93460_cov67-Phaeocystis_antarctica.AAC.1